MFDDLCKATSRQVARSTCRSSEIRKEKVQRGNAMIHDALQPRQQQESRLHTDPEMQDHPPVSQQHL